MLAVGQKQLIFGIIAQTAVLVGGSLCCAQYSSDRLLVPQDRNTSSVINAGHEVSQVFAENGDNDQYPFLHPRLRKSKPSVLRLLGHEAPPLPPPPAFSEYDEATGNEQLPSLYDSTTSPATTLTPIPMAEPVPGFAPIESEACEPVFDGVVRDSCCYDVENWSPIARWFGYGRDRSANACQDLGIGHERVMFAPFQIDTTQPYNYMMVRWDNGRGLQTPDRSEFFWSMPGKGPAVSPNSINYQEVRFISETAATESISIMTEIPIRLIQPDGSGWTGGLGDMKVATKARLVNGKSWQITQIFRTYIPTGDATKGVGTGHVSLEPGVLARYEINPSTFVHGEVEFLIPIAADVGFASDVLTYGVGISHVWYETNNFAIIPDLEMVNYDFLTGQKTLNGVNVPVNGETAINLIPGARFVVGPKGDLGLFEFGISGVIGMGDRYLNEMLRLDFKFVY